MLAQELDEIKRKLVEQLSPVRLYLFGSYADGTYTEDSDLDLYIVVHNDVSDLSDAASRAYRAVRDVKRRPVDILVGTLARFEEKRLTPSVENEVYRTGVLLFC